MQAGKVREKTYGKQKVYLVDQSNFKEASSDELKNMEKQIEDTEKAVKSTEQSLKEYQMQLKELTSSLTTEEARQQVAEVRFLLLINFSLRTTKTIENVKSMKTAFLCEWCIWSWQALRYIFHDFQLNEEISALEAKYKQLSSNIDIVDSKERERIRQKRESYVRPWRKWKRKCNDILDTILENYPNGKKSLYEDIDIQTDEDARVVMPKNWPLRRDKTVHE